MYNYRVSIANNIYKRELAVDYALTYGLSPNPNFRFFDTHGDGGGDCSNFISQCLYAGGAPMDFKSAKPWWYKRQEKIKDTWSVSWSVAHSLYWTLKARWEMRIPGIKALEVKDIKLLETGDIIQYEDSKGIIYHSAIITFFAKSRKSMHPLITQHSFNAINISPIKPRATKMHLMKIVVN